jgi:hypothetical protein
MERHRELLELCRGECGITMRCGVYTIVSGGRANARPENARKREKSGERDKMGEIKEAGKS